MIGFSFELYETLIIVKHLSLKCDLLLDRISSFFISVFELKLRIHSIERCSLCSSCSTCQRFWDSSWFYYKRTLRSSPSLAGAFCIHGSLHSAFILEATPCQEIWCLFSLPRECFGHKWFQLIPPSALFCLLSIMI